jgi:hypothetical protein
MNIILFLFKVVVFKGRQGLETALNQGFIGKIKIKTKKTGRGKVNTPHHIFRNRRSSTSSLVQAGSRSHDPPPPYTHIHPHTRTHAHIGPWEGHTLLYRGKGALLLYGRIQGHCERLSAYVPYKGYTYTRSARN